MFLQYGTTTLKVIDLTRFERETEWSDDMMDLLSIKVVIGATCTLAPGGTPALPSATALSPDTIATLDGTDKTVATLAADPRGRNPGLVAAVAGTPLLETDFLGGGVDPALFRSGPQTDAELRARLWTPRQKLILWAYERDGAGGAIRWLESPRPGMAIDVRGGPKPLAVDVVAASGEPNSVAIHFQVMTHVSPCPTGSDRLILSHRWEMSHTHDEDFYATRVIRGRMVFNLAVAQKTGMRADFIRAQFIHPIPLGYRRNVPRLTLSSDGSVLDYEITDTDPTVMFSPGDSGATRIDIAEQINMGVNRTI